jgi:hypothetical protein
MLSSAYNARLRIGAYVCSDLRRMDVLLVTLIWLSDIHMIESLGHGDKCPKRNTIPASNNVLKNPVSRSTASHPLGNLPATRRSCEMAFGM